ncbi:hypothetical protein [Devosia sp.]|uniref:hypothetical protein n=1 Tax=Devosia sp. TaxID=1871048 RepID=UPI00292DA56C|nr:hypothetical protein [Devosia sp.]
MQRLTTLIVLIFAFAALAGATTAHAHRYVSTPIVVLNHVDADNQSIPVVVAVQRGQIDLGSGIMMPCGPHQAIPVAVMQLPAGAPTAGVPPGADEEAPDWSGAGPLRPPRQV